jgi:hypothetical protein
MMGSRCTAAMALALSGFALACSSSAEPPEPPSFDRPSAFTFVCVNKTILNDVKQDPAKSLTPLKQCDKSPNAPVASVGDFELHALIAQSSRGEVSAVDVVAKHTIDSRNDIPGATFVPAGELPAAIVTAPDYPRTTYVANAGSRDISVLRTDAFLRVYSGETYLRQHVTLRAPDDASGTQSSSPVMPFDMIVSPDQKALFVSAPQDGLLLKIPLKRCDDPASDDCPGSGDIDEDTSHWLRIPLEDSWAKLPAEAFAQVPTENEPYTFTCDTNPPLQSLPSDAKVELPSGASDMRGAPQPAGLALDVYCRPEDSAQTCADSGRPRQLLVADKRQPIVHVIDLDRLAPGMEHDAIMTPVLTGAPTERVVVTPAVPVLAEESDSAASKQYVYAIDARDGSVLVSDMHRTQVVSVNPSARADRVDLGPTMNNTSGAPVALSLALLTPNFDVFGPAEQWVQSNSGTPTEIDPLLCLDPTHTVRSTARLRGVFVAIGLTDGSVRIVNVHDMELANCRYCAPLAEKPPKNEMWIASYPDSPGYDPYPVVRNRPRIGVTFAPTAADQTPYMSPRVVAQFEIDGALIGIRSDDGTTNDTRVPGLACLACSPTQAVSFPTPDPVVMLGTSATPSDQDMPSDADMLTSECPEKQGRMCSAADPWIDPLGWAAEHEGAIDGAIGRGRFIAPGADGNVTGELEFVLDRGAEMDLCGLGVLGDDDAEGCTRNDTAALGCGDQLVINSELLPPQLRGSGANADLCNALVSARDVDHQRIAFRIHRAYADRVAIGTTLIPATTRRPSATWEQVEACFGAPSLGFSVRAGDAFIVRSQGQVPFQHRVVRNANDHDRCQNDPKQPSTRTSRAYPNQVFDNGLISFKLSPGSYDRDALLRIIPVNGAPKLWMNAADTGAGLVQGVMPIALRYIAYDNHLYVLDITTRGLMPVPLDPMPIAVFAADSVQ